MCILDKNIETGRYVLPVPVLSSSLEQRPTMFLKEERACESCSKLPEVDVSE